MPDAQGNFRGISVSAEAWERVFGDRMAAHDHDWERNPSAGGSDSSGDIWVWDPRFNDEFNERMTRQHQGYRIG